ncbi:hypothetical protein ACHAPT_005967 [Fusarium lateritium]
MSLKTLLQQSYKDIFGSNERLTLAYNLSCTLLQTYRVDMQWKWEPEDIFFLYNEKEKRIYELNYPYVASGFLSDQKLARTNNRFPVLIYFTKLLLEIGLGELFVPQRRRFDIDLADRVQSNDAKDSLMQGFSDAIMECLQATNPSHMNNPTDEETQCRKVIFDLVSRLKKARDSYHTLDPKRSRKVSIEIGSAEEFLERAEEFRAASVGSFTSRPDIRIAILDTGIRMSTPCIKGAKHSRSDRDCAIKESKSFISVRPDDECGHGTNVASLILRIFPEANLYTAKISQSNDQNDTSVDQIVEAIEWARSFNVHIINMSFSMPKASAVRRIIKKAENDGIIIFAAASNCGIHSGRSFPASLDTVLCIHAADGNGNKSAMNPNPEPYRDNLSTLGVAIPSDREEGVSISGTSYATPVAAGMAAVILAFMDAAVAAGEMQPEDREEAFDRQGMRRILLKMSVSRDGYNCIVPWREFWPPDASQQMLILKIQEALN